MRKILVVLSNENVANQIILFSKSLKKKYKFDVIIYKKKKSKLDLIRLNKLANLLKPNKIVYVEELPNIKYFSILNFLTLLNYKKNRFYYQKLKNFLIRKKIYTIDHHLVFFSNENLVNYLLFKNNSKKFFFAHAPNDILIQIKKNFFYKIKNKFECFVNNNFMYNFNKTDENFKYVSIFSNYSKQKKKNEIIISPKEFKLFFNKQSKYSFKNLKKKIILIDFTFPYKHYEDKYDNNIISSYLVYFFNNVLNKIFVDKKYLHILKFKNSIPYKIQKKILKKVIKRFPNYQIKILENSIKNSITVEKLISNLKIEKYYTTFSTSMFYSKILNKNLKIFDYTNLIIEFWRDNLTKIKTRKNFENLKFMKTKYIKFAKNI